MKNITVQLYEWSILHDGDSHESREAPCGWVAYMRGHVKTE